MASVSLIEGLAKKFINMVPRPFYTEAAQKLVHEICETIYKDLDEKDKFPRVEIIKIVEDFITAHLLNTDTEDPSGIRKAIEDSLTKTTLEVYKDDVVNMLLLKNIISGELGPDGKPMENGIFYNSLKQSINITNNPDSNNADNANNANNSGDVDNKNNKKDKNDDTNKEKKETDKDSETFAKKVVNELVNTNVEIAVSNQPNQVVGGDGGIFNVLSKNAAGFAKTNPMLAATGMAIGAAMLSRSQNNNGNGSGNGSGSGSGNGGTTNIGYEPNKNGVLPYIQTNCNGSGLGMPNIDLDFLGKILDNLKEPIAEELVKKIQERLPDKTIDSVTVKSDIYNKILLVIQSHLQSQQGKDMLLGHINKVIQPEIDVLSNNDEMNKRLIKVIFKNKSSELYKKFIEIIATNTSRPKEDSANIDVQKEENEKITNPNNANFNTDISKVIIDFYNWIDNRIKQSNGFPELKKSIKEAAIAQFKIALVEQQKKMLEENKKQEGEFKNAIETTIQEVAVESVNAKIIESMPPAKKEPLELNVTILPNETRPATDTATVENSTNDGKIKGAAIGEVDKNVKNLPPPPPPPVKGGNPNTKKRRTKHNKTKKKNRKQKHKK
jgi:hypothetical protein